MVRLEPGKSVFAKKQSGTNTEGLAVTNTKSIKYCTYLI